MQEELENDEEEFFEHHRITADPGQTPVRIDKFLMDRLENSTRSKIQNAAKNGEIIVNDLPVKQNYKVKPGDVISVVMTYPKMSTEIIPENIPLEIIYEDDDLLVVNKDAGMVVHPGHNNYTGTLVHALTYHIDNLPQAKDHNLRPGLIHRLDKNTSGIMVVGKTESAMNNLCDQFAARTTYRRYYALVWGSFEEREGTVTGNISRSLKNRKIMDVFDDPEIGKHAVTHYKVLEEFDYVTLVECRLETGRTHQIRVHMKHIGHPLFGDVEYGGDQILRGTHFTKYKQFVQNCFKLMPHQTLHAKELGFHHPTTGEWMQFDSELPSNFEDLIAKWRNYVAHRVD